MGVLLQIFFVSEVEVRKNRDLSFSDISRYSWLIQLFLNDNNWFIQIDGSLISVHTNSIIK